MVKMKKNKDNLKKGNVYMEKIIVSNPAMEYFLSKFRDKDTKTYECNICVENLSLFLAAELSKYLSMEEKNIITPLGEKKCNVINEEVVFIPVLRAGVAMLGGFQRILPESKVGFIWAHRDENANAKIDKYKFPNDKHMDNGIKGKTIIILDTMLATAGTVNACAELVKSYQPKQILCASILSTEIGVNNLSKSISVLATASLSDSLDEKAYICPGVGDSGDRLYG